jgi:hypothetical protein
MHYAYEIPVLPAHTASAPLLYPIVLAAGVITSVRITFRYGCDCLIRCRLYDGSEQILPTNVEGFYAFDGDTVDAKLWYDLSQEYNSLMFVAWNIGTKLTHVITVQVEVQAVDEPSVAKSVQYLSDAITNLVVLMRSWF